MKAAMRRCWRAGGLVLLLSPAWAQVAAPPAAITASENVLAPGGAASDVTLAGTVRLWRGGQPETGTVMLEAVRGGASRVVWQLPSGVITEQWAPASSDAGAAGSGTLTGKAAQGLVTQPAGASILMPGWAWFAPAQLLDRVASGAAGAADLGLEPRLGVPRRHLQLWRLHGRLAIPLEQDTIDVYLDPSTHLPSAMVFRIRPYQKPGTTPPPHIRPRLGMEEVRFSNYATIAGRVVPMRIEGSLRSRPIFDITLGGAAFNQGLRIGALH